VTRLKDKPFILLGVSTDPERENVLEFQRDGKVTWRSWWNGKRLKGQDKRITNLWEVSTLPTLFLIDHKGKVRKRFDGVPENGELDRLIDKLVQEAQRDQKPAS
jgi:hypothetical protein